MPKPLVRHSPLARDRTFDRAAIEHEFFVYSCRDTQLHVVRARSKSRDCEHGPGASVGARRACGGIRSAGGAFVPVDTQCVICAVVGETQPDTRAYNLYEHTAEVRGYRQTIKSQRHLRRIILRAEEVLSDTCCEG